MTFLLNIAVVTGSTDGIGKAYAHKVLPKIYSLQQRFKSKRK